MKSGHDKYETSEFPQEEVYAAMSKGIQEGKRIKATKNEKSHKNTWKRKLVYAPSAAIMALILFAGSAYVSPAFANVVSHIPIVGSIFQELGRVGLQQAHEKGLTSTVGETQTVEGTSITIDEVLYDQTRLTLSYSIESEEPLEENYLGFADMIYYINGKSPSGGSGSLQETLDSPTSGSGIIEYDFLDEEIPDDFQFDLFIEPEDGKEWAFSIPVGTMEELEILPVQHNQTAGDMEINVTQLSKSPSGISLHYEAISPGKDQGMDHLRTEAMYLEFRMTDEDGNEITSHSGGTSGTTKGDEVHVTGKKLFDPVDAGVEEVMITPYIMIPTGGGGVEVDEDGNTKEVESQIDELEEIEFEPFTVTLP